MKKLTLFLCTFIFFGSLTVFGEEVKDVGLICEKIKSEIPTHLTFWFKGNQKVEFYIRDKSDYDNDGDTTEYVNNKEFSEKGSYSSTDQHISIYHSNKLGKMYGEWTTKINRFTLELRENFLGEDSIYYCEVYSTKDKFLSELQKVETSLRKFLDKRKI